MRKQILALLLAVSMLVIPVYAAEDSMNNFTRSKEYAGQFSDLTTDSTFYENVAALYEYGLSVGKGDGTFGLTDSLTVSQTIIFAGRIRSLYRTGDAEAGPAAYVTEEPQAACIPYLAYLQAEGVLGPELDQVLFTPATRAQMAHVLANVLPEKVLPAANREIVDEAYAAGKLLPDVTAETPYQQDILQLYRCGISHGSDEMGSFRPDEPITRGAAAAMLTRMVDPGLRIQFVWEPQVPDLSGITMADLVTPGTYIASPVTDEELDESIRYMLAAGEDQLTLSCPGITEEEKYQLLERVIWIIKSYAEQGYNAVRGEESAAGDLQFTFRMIGAEERTQEYRSAALEAAVAVHDALWAEGAITSDMSEKEKALVYYVWICTNCEYDYREEGTELSHTPYNLFLNGLAVCDGYTSSYNLLLKLEGIDCKAYLTEDHLWTVATLDGEEYHIDTTWGDLGDSAWTRFFAMTPEQSALEHGVTL